ncbi:MAG: hypothetical protein CMN58_04695 [Solibacterales bacterium]|nr:hypothetical protein [Bryobacterales bacterium]|tara:strand:- start:18781 stop:19479 length:699 start_codon:yes stop_codon:yes gene_type:complete
METSLEVLLFSAASIGFVHTLIGIDHSLPFVVLGRARGWSLRKVWSITFLCGFGHVLSSVLLGGLGIGLGVAIASLEWVEGMRGEIAAWLLIIFGLFYAGWSFARQRRQQRHIHSHDGGMVHSHEHGVQDHSHDVKIPAAATAWSLFIIFVLGPCEPLIPLLMAPAVSLGPWAVVPVTAVFGFTTIITMLVAVTVGFYGFKLTPLKRLEAHANTLAGLAIACSGLAIQLLGI